MTIEQLLELLMQSPIHRKWPLEGIVRCFWPPLLLNQYRGRIENGKLVWLVTWATLTDEAGDGLISGKRPLQSADWNAGKNLWFVDVIGPGRGREMIREMEALFAGRYPCAYSRRTRPDGTRHRHLWVSAKKEIAA